MRQRLWLISIWLPLVIAAAGCSSSRPAALDFKSAEDRYRLVSENMDKLATGGRVSQVHWSEDGKSVEFTRAGQRWTCDLASHSLQKADRKEENASQPQSKPRSRPDRPQPGRGRQREREVSPDGKWVAVCRDWNVIIEPADSGQEKQGGQGFGVTSDGTRKFRYGTASWVYGEELDQHDAMWWTPDSSKLVFYEFDERQVPDHYLTAGLTELHTRVLTEGYPKPGEPNPIANLLVYDMESKQTIRVDPAEEPDWYTYAVQIALDGRHAIFNRTNRHQNILHVILADLETGKTRIVLTEKQECWQDNAPEMRFLADGRRFIWATEKSGWRQLELRDLDGTLIKSLTKGDYPVGSIVALDEDAGVLYYTAYSDANPLNLQLHCVNLDGSGARRLTIEPFSHSVQMSPDRKWFITTFEAMGTPPATALYDTEGHRVATLAESDCSKMKELGLAQPTPFEFTADDGKTTLHGVLFKPSHFDPAAKYPLLVSVYGGPMIVSVSNRYVPANALCEYGFLVAQIENRGTPNRGKAFETATYLKLGQVDLKDQVDGVKYLERRSYVDSNRVGIFGHSYGGYMSALAILKYPDVFQAACAGGTVTDWRNYDTIYTERFMRTPQENQAGYDAGSCLTFASQLKGKLLLLHGMVDDNVHPSNVWQLVSKLQAAGKPFEMMFYPDYGHSMGPVSAPVQRQFFRRCFYGS